MKVASPIVSASWIGNDANKREIPNEDSLVFEFDETNLFEPDRFTGLDKVEAQADAVAKRVHQWLHVEGLKPEEVAVLVAKRPKGRLYELLTERKAAAEAEWAFEAHGRGRCVLVDTVARFKGLEAHAVILWVGDEIADDAQWETLYVGTTRAKSLLSIVGSTKVVRALRAHPK